MRVRPYQSNKRQWFNWISVLTVAVVALTAGALILVASIFWFHPTSPTTKRKEFKEAHLISESSSFYSYSTDTSYTAEVIYEGYKGSSKFSVVADAQNAYRIDAPYEVNRVEFIIHETSHYDKDTKKITKTNLKSFDKVAYRSSQDPSKWFSTGGHVSKGAKVLGTNAIKQINVGNARVVTDSVGMVNLLKGLDKTGKYARSIFTNKTVEEILKQDIDSKWKIQDIKLAAGPKDYENYQAYKTKNQNVEGSIHKYFWDATVVNGPFGSRQGNVEHIEPNVIKVAYSFSVLINKNGASERVKGFLIKSNTGNDPKLGVKYGTILSKDGANFAGIPINGKTWIKQLGLVSAPANDIDGIYTIILTGTTTYIDSAAQEIAGAIGGMN